MRLLTENKLLIFYIVAALIITAILVIKKELFKRDTPCLGQHEPSQKIMVEIAGAVEKPGVYEVTDGARVVDLLVLGGEVVSEASVEYVAKTLNLSEKLTDSQKIYIPFEWELVDAAASTIAVLEATKKSTTSGTVEGLVNVNTCSDEDLISLPKIGEVTAARIIDNRPYANLEELEIKAALSSSVMEAIAGLVTF